MKDVKGVPGNPRRDRLVRALTAMLVADLLIALAVVYFLSPGDRKISDILSTISKDRTILWGLGAAFGFVGLVTFLAFRSSGKCPGEFASFAGPLGLMPIRKWGFEGGFGNVSLLGIGSYYETTYKGHTLKYCPIVEDVFPGGGRLSLGHTGSVGARFFGRYGLRKVASEAPNSGECKDRFAGRLRPEEHGGMEIWAVEEEKAGALFRDRNVTDAVSALQAELNGADDGGGDPSGQTGFVVNEKAVTVIFVGPVAITRSLVDAMAALSSALRGARISEEKPRVGLLRRFCRPAFFLFIAVTVFAVLAQLATSVLEFMRR